MMGKFNLSRLFYLVITSSLILWLTKPFIKQVSDIKSDTLKSHSWLFEYLLYHDLNIPNNFDKTLFGIYSLLFFIALIILFVGLDMIMSTKWASCIVVALFLWVFTIPMKYIGSRLYDNSDYQCFGHHCFFINYLFGIDPESWNHGAENELMRITAKLSNIMMTLVFIVFLSVVFVWGWRKTIVKENVVDYQI